MSKLEMLFDVLNSSNLTRAAAKETGVLNVPIYVEGSHPQVKFEYENAEKMLNAFFQNQTSLASKCHVFKKDDDLFLIYTSNFSNLHGTIEANKKVMHFDNSESLKEFILTDLHFSCVYDYEHRLNMAVSVDRVSEKNNDATLVGSVKTRIMELRDKYFIKDETFKLKR